MKKETRLGVNVDHAATVRQARGTAYPDPVLIAKLAIAAGADGITMHLREDRRHVQDNDIVRAQNELLAPLNLEMSIAEEIVQFAEKMKPPCCCLVPERREERTTEGGLDVVAEEARIKKICERLAKRGTQVSLFIAPDSKQIDAVVRCGAPVIEIHTGSYADAKNAAEQKKELEKIIQAAGYAAKKGLIVNGGHGLNIDNVSAIAAIPEMHELNIGHAIIADALEIGIAAAVRRMIYQMGKVP